LLLYLERDGVIGDAFNMGSAAPFTTTHAADTLARLTGLPILRITVPGPALRLLSVEPFAEDVRSVGIVVQRDDRDPPELPDRVERDRDRASRPRRLHADVRLESPDVVRLGLEDDTWPTRAASSRRNPIGFDTGDAATERARHGNGGKSCGPEPRDDNVLAGPDVRATKGVAPRAMR
jgi:hypothetical protein